MKSKHFLYFSDLKDSNNKNKNTSNNNNNNNNNNSNNNIKVYRPLSERFSQSREFSPVCLNTVKCINL